MSVELLLALIRVALYATALTYGLYRRNVLVVVVALGASVVALLNGVRHTSTAALIAMPVGALLAFALVRLADIESEMRARRDETSEGVPP